VKQQNCDAIRRFVTEVSPLRGVWPQQKLSNRSQNPAYQDYTTRAKISEVVVMASPAKLAVAETTSSLGNLASVTVANSGYVFPGATKYVSGITITPATGVVTATSTVPNAIGTIILTPTEIAGTGQLTWVCSSTTILPKFLPAECR
jgi:type IV pilus assembly protein PilA